LEAARGTDVIQLDRRQILGRLAASLAVFGAVFVVSVEIGLRLGGWFTERVVVFQPPAPDGYSVFDPDIGRLLIPGRSGVCRRTEFTYSVRSNDLGFRDEELPAVKDPEELRLWVIGDSVTSGYGVPEEERYTEILERLLDSAGRVKERNGRRVRVVNSGISGLGTRSEAAILDRFIDRVQPDAVLLQFTTDNDLSDNLHFTRWKVRGGEFEEPQDGDAGPVRRFLRHHSHLYHLLGSLKRLNAPAIPVSPEERAATSEGLEAFRSICDRRAVPLTVALMAMRGTFDSLDSPGSYEWDSYQVATEILRAGGFRVIDTIGRVRSDADRDRQFFTLDPHPNAMGHARLAGILAEEDLLQLDEPRVR
jgi:hypothetical protein